MSTFPDAPLLGQPIGHEIVVVDIEGNGQQPPDIVEIAVLPMTGGRPVTPAGLRTWLIRPPRPITGLVTRKVHGISNDDVAHAPPWTDVADQVATAITGRVMVAHNASVERRVLSAHLPDWYPPLVLDTFRLAKRVWSDLPGGYGLDNLIVHAHLTSPHFDRADSHGDGAGAGRSELRRHRAAYDTWMTAALLAALARDSGLDWDQLCDAARLPAPRAPRSSGAGREGLW